MVIRELRKADFDLIVQVIDHWWGGPSTALAHPIFFYEFGGAALEADEGDRLIGFLLGFVAPSEPPLGYIHLVGVDPEFRKSGVGRALYGRFEETCRQKNVRQIKAITTVGNTGSREFHEAMGFAVEEALDYAGPGRARLVFRKTLS